MKVKDLPKHQILTNVRVVIPNEVSDAELGMIGLQQRDVYFSSGWDYTDDGGEAGIWLKLAPGDGRMFPLCMHRPKEVLEWEVIKEGTVIPVVNPTAKMSDAEAKKWKDGHVCETKDESVSGS